MYVSVNSFLEGELLGCSDIIAGDVLQCVVSFRMEEISISIK